MMNAHGIFTSLLFTLTLVLGVSTTGCDVVDESTQARAGDADHCVFDGDEPEPKPKPEPDPKPDSDPKPKPKPDPKPKPKNFGQIQPDGVDPGANVDELRAE